MSKGGLLAFVLILAVTQFASACDALRSRIDAGGKLYPIPEVGTITGMTAGPDGRIWFTQSMAKAVGAIDARGAVTMYQNPINIDADGEGIAAGPDGALWMTQVNPHDPVDSGADMIGRITISGNWSEFPIQSWDALPQGIAAGPDGAMWFAERHANAIGRITMRGRITEFPLPHAASGPRGIARGADGKMWFTEMDGNRIGSIDPSTGKIAEYALPNPKSKPGPIALGPSNDVYVGELGRNRIARISRDRSISDAFSVRGPPLDLARCGQGLCYLEASSVDWMSGAARTAPLVWPVEDAQPLAVTAGQHDMMWYAVRKGPTYGYSRTCGIGFVKVGRGP